MRRFLLGLALGSTVMLGACETSPPVAQGAAVGATAGAVAGAATGVGVLEGAAVGAAIGGLAGAVWSDPNNTGYVTGYTQNGQYYPGPPPGYDPATHSVVTGPMPGDNVLRSAVIGAAVPGLPGAVWADRNNDGIVDGYVYNGQYYPGVPPGFAGSAPPPPLAAPPPAPAQAPAPAPAPARGQNGERG